MPMQKKDPYRGAALSMIIDQEPFKALNRVPGPSRNHYMLNHHTHLFIKYSKKPGAAGWNFSFRKEEIEKVQVAHADGSPVCVALVCDGEEVCGLDAQQFLEIVDVNKSSVQNVVVSWKRTESMRVRSGRKQYKRTFPRTGPNAFPRMLFK